MNKINTQQNSVRKTFVPNTNLSLTEHRPLRWLVRQFFNEKEEDGQTYSHEVIVGYHNKIEAISGMPPILAQALDNLNRFGGELWADYNDNMPVLVKRFNLNKKSL